MILVGLVVVWLMPTCGGMDNTVAWLLANNGVWLGKEINSLLFHILKFCFQSQIETRA